MMLGKTQKRVFDFICQYHKAHDYAPTFAEIAIGIGIRSRGVAHRYVKELQQMGVIDVVAGRSRGIKISSPIERQENDWILPLLGRIAAGRPIEAIPDHSEINLAEFLLGPDRFALHVVGDSMVEAGIMDGDTIILRRSAVAENGDIVVALIDDDEATLKRLQKNRDGSLTLIPANQKLSAIRYRADRVKIQGVAVGQMRSYR